QSTSVPSWNIRLWEALRQASHAFAMLRQVKRERSAPNYLTFPSALPVCMKVSFVLLLLSGFFGADAQYVGPPNNVGREYGNPKMPLMVSHLAGANKERLKRANRNSRHSVFGKILCFRKLCRIQSGHSASLRAISYKKFRKK